MTVHIGTSGFSYPDWRGRFFPVDLLARDELAYCAKHFASVEINRSFYALLSPAACRAWDEATPRGFLFPLEGSQFLTHRKRLRDPRQALANFFAAGPLTLGEKLGPIVWQLPKNFTFDEARLATFFETLPRTTEGAAALAREHDARAAVADTEPRGDWPLRHVIEPRHASFHHPAFARLARQHRVAIAVAVAVADGKEWSRIEEPTTDLMYLRLHGDVYTYFSNYDDDALAAWADRIVAWERGDTPDAGLRLEAATPLRAKDVFVYFDDTALGHATDNALELRALLARRKVRSSRGSVRPPRVA